MSGLEIVSEAHGVQHTPKLHRVRSHVAIVRALLEELDGVLPSADGAVEFAIGKQLIDELTQLGERVLECAARMTPAEGQTLFDSTPDEF